MFVLPGKSFRDEQCEKYNSDRYLDSHGNIKQWIPKYNGVSPRDRCKLFCRARGSNEFKVFEAKVAITLLKFEIVTSWLKLHHYNQKPVLPSFDHWVDSFPTH